MAPTSGQRLLTHSRSSRPSSHLSTPVRVQGSMFSNTKRDKRTIKHSALISRIEKSKAPSKKRRRPSKKLITTLESLADALPDIADDGTGETVIADAKIRHRSLKSRPGAMKKKEALVNMEKERFNQNMAQMAVPSPDIDNTNGVNTTEMAKGSSGSGSRWAALRGFIQQTMEQRSDDRA